MAWPPQDLLCNYALACHAVHRRCNESYAVLAQALTEKGVVMLRSREGDSVVK